MNNIFDIVRYRCTAGHEFDYDLGTAYKEAVKRLYGENIKGICHLSGFRLANCECGESVEFVRFVNDKAEEINHRLNAYHLNISLSRT